MLDRYVAQVRLLVDMLPEVAAESDFALKGGTAINLFYRDLPRLSVDIDLTWLPVTDRASSLREIDNALNRIVTSINRRKPRITAFRPKGGGSSDNKMLVRSGRVQIKIETSPVARGVVFPPKRMVVSEIVMESFRIEESTVFAFVRDAILLRQHSGTGRRLAYLRRPLPRSNAHASCNFALIELKLRTRSSDRYRVE